MTDDDGDLFSFEPVLPDVPVAAVSGFSGHETYDHERDYDRLKRQLLNVWRMMRDKRWHTLAEISEHTGGSEAAVSARLRDFRKLKYGSWEVLREHVGHGLWRYRLTGHHVEHYNGNQAGDHDDDGHE